VEGAGQVCSTSQSCFSDHNHSAAQLYLKTRPAWLDKSGPEQQPLHEVASLGRQRLGVSAQGLGRMESASALLLFSSALRLLATLRQKMQAVHHRGHPMLVLQAVRKAQDGQGRQGLVLVLQEAAAWCIRLGGLAARFQALCVRRGQAVAKALQWRAHPRCLLAALRCLLWSLQRWRARRRMKQPARPHLHRGDGASSVMCARHLQMWMLGQSISLAQMNPPGRRPPPPLRRQLRASGL